MNDFRFISILLAVIIIGSVNNVRDIVNIIPTKQLVGVIALCFVVWIIARTAKKKGAAKK